MIVMFLAILLGIALFALIWTFIGYPLLMLVWSKTNPKPPDPDKLFEQPHVTILIPTYNEADVIREKLENTLALDYPANRLNVVVVDDNSDDGTRDIISEFDKDRVTLIHKPERTGKMQSVNRGMQEIDKDEIVILSDASPSYNLDVLDYLLPHFGNPEIGVVVGTLAVFDNEAGVAKPAGLYWKYESALRLWESMTGNTVAVHGNLFAIRRKIFHAFENTTINDEFSIAMDVIQQGYRVVYEPRAMSYDYASGNMHEEFDRRVRINAGRYQALFDNGYLSMLPTKDDAFRLISHKFLRVLAPIFMIIVLALSLILLATTEWLWVELLLGAQIAFYTLAIIGWILDQAKIRLPIVRVIYYFVGSNIAGLFGLWRYLNGTQGVNWKKRQVV